MRVSLTLKMIEMKDTGLMNGEKGSLILGVDCKLAKFLGGRESSSELRMTDNLEKDSSQFWFTFILELK